MLGITDVWTVLILRPMLNVLLWLYSVLGGQFWLAIIIFTIVIRLLMTPLMLPQQRSAKRMQALQPRLQELQKKYGKDREKMAQEQMALYKEAGVNPMGGCLPMLVQFPIWIGLYQSIIQALGYQPLQLLNLSKNIYPFLQSLWAAVPLNRFFLGMDLSLTPQQLGGVTFALPVLVAFTSWLQTRMTTPPTGGSDQSASMTQSMTMMMPLMFGFFSLNFSTGLSLYFVVSNVIGIISQGFISGWSGLVFWKNLNLKNMSLGSLLGGGVRPAAAPQQETSKRPEAKVVEGRKGTQSESKNRRKKRRRKR